MKTYSEDRYYEAQETKEAELDEFISDWMDYEMDSGGYCDPKERSNLMEALGELNMREEIESWEDCTQEEQDQVTRYWFDLATTLAERAYYER